mmetsp:Transcript_42349/g.100493  ORF Transcript_42349/g.100493 Transcript_42349/m.100493 type:complete len:293 (+) Transcript_42349:180-1058(+)
MASISPSAPPNPFSSASRWGCLSPLSGVPPCSSGFRLRLLCFADTSEAFFLCGNAASKDSFQSCVLLNSTSAVTTSLMFSTFLFAWRLVPASSGKHSSMGSLADLSPLASAHCLVAFFFVVRSTIPPMQYTSPSRRSPKTSSASGDSTTTFSGGNASRTSRPSLLTGQPSAPILAAKEAIAPSQLQKVRAVGRAARLFDTTLYSSCFAMLLTSRSENSWMKEHSTTTRTPWASPSLTRSCCSRCALTCRADGERGRGRREGGRKEWMHLQRGSGGSSRAKGRGGGERGSNRG